METVVITRSKVGSYSVIEYSHYEMWNLGMFLTDETGKEADSWKRFVLDPTRGLRQGNITYLIKKGANFSIICIGDGLVEGGPLFCLPAEDFISSFIPIF